SDAYKVTEGVGDLSFSFILAVIYRSMSSEFFFSSRRRHTRSVSAFLLNRSSDLAASGGIQGDVLATDNNTVGMGDAGIKSAIQGSNVPNPDEAVPSFVSGAMAKAGKGLLEGTLQAGTSAVSDKLLDLVGL